MADKDPKIFTIETPFIFRVSGLPRVQWIATKKYLDKTGINDQFCTLDGQVFNVVRYEDWEAMMEALPFLANVEHVAWNKVSKKAGRK